MFRRLVIVMAAALLPLAVPVTSIAATSTTPGEFVGDWTPDSTSAAEFVGKSLSLTDEGTTSTRDEVEPDLQADFDLYCDPTRTSPVTFFTLQYSWGPAGTMGGCNSPKTKGHVYAWGTNNDVAYVHPGTKNGEPLLNGDWGTRDASNNVAYQAFTAHRALMTFVTHDRFSQLVRQNGGPVYRQTKVSGVGEFRLLVQHADNCSTIHAATADGSLQLQIARVSGQNLVEMYDLTLAIASADQTGTYEVCDGQRLLRAADLRVKTSDPTEKDACKVGTAGHLSLADRTVQSGGDTVRITIPECDLVVALSQKAVKRKGDHVAVAMDVNDNGY